MERSLAEYIVTSVTKLTPTDEGFYGTVYEMDIKKDRFIHFTTKDRAEQIVSSGNLLMRPPYKKFGIDAVTAVSIVWGSYVPGVQTTHIGSNDLVGVVFRTNKKPSSAYPEEVIWRADVPVKRPSIVGFKEGVRLLKRSNPPPDDDFSVHY